MINYFFSLVVFLSLVISFGFTYCELYSFASMMAFVVLCLNAVSSFFVDTPIQKVFLSFSAGSIVAGICAALWYFGSSIMGNSLFFATIPFLCQLVLIALELATPRNSQQTESASGLKGGVLPQTILTNQ